MFGVSAQTFLTYNHGVIPLFLVNSELIWTFSVSYTGFILHIIWTCADGRYPYLDAIDITCRFPNRLKEKRKK